MSQSQWSKLERGRFDKTSWLPAISVCYGVSVQWLHDGTGPKFMPKSVREAREREAIAQAWPDLAQLIDHISPKQRQSLAAIAIIAAQGRLTDEDVEILAQTARALAARR